MKMWISLAVSLELLLFPFQQWSFGGMTGRPANASPNASPRGASAGQFRASPSSSPRLSAPAPRPTGKPSNYHVPNKLAPRRDAIGSPSTVHPRSAPSLWRSGDRGTAGWRRDSGWHSSQHDWRNHDHDRDRDHHHSHHRSYYYFSYGFPYYGFYPAYSYAGSWYYAAPPSYDVGTYVEPDYAPAPGYAASDESMVDYYKLGANWGQDLRREVVSWDRFVAFLQQVFPTLAQAERDDLRHGFVAGYGTHGTEAWDKAMKEATEESDADAVEED